MDPKYLYFIIFFCITYLIITDENIAGLASYSSRLLQFHYKKIKWILLNDPRNPIVRWNIEQRSYKLAKEIQDEMERRSKTSNDNSTTDK